MAILKLNILTEVNKRTARAETDIDSILKAVLMDLTIDFPFLKKKHTDISTVKGTPNYSLDDTWRKIELIKINDKAPLEKINTWEEYQELIAGETESNWREPKTYIIYNRILYLYPTPDKIYTLTIFTSYIGRDVNSIDLDDNFEEVLITGCEFMLYRSKSLGTSPPAVLAMQLYERQKEQLKKIYSEAGERIKYSDI